MNNKGFTLIEFLIVVAIISCLSAVVLLTINPKDKLKSAREQKFDEEVFCKIQGLSPVKDLPVMCLKYYNITTSNIITTR